MTENWVLNSKRSHPVSASGSNCSISDFFAPVILFDSCLPVHLILLFFISLLRYFCVVPFWLSYWSDLRSDTDLLLELKAYLGNIWTWTASLLNGKLLFESLVSESRWQLGPDRHQAPHCCVNWKKEEFEAADMKTWKLIAMHAIHTMHNKILITSSTLRLCTQQMEEGQGLVIVRAAIQVEIKWITWMSF